MRTITLIVILLSLSDFARAQNFRVVSPQFSRLALKDNTVVDPAVNDMISQALLRPQGKLYFSFTVLGDKNTCEYLEKNDQLEIRVELFTGIFSARTYHLDITQERWEDLGPAIRERCSTEGIFTFRTRLFTRRIEQGSITIHVRDVEGRNILSQSVVIKP